MVAMWSMAAHMQTPADEQRREGSLIGWRWYVSVRSLQAYIASKRRGAA